MAMDQFDRAAEDLYKNIIDDVEHAGRAFTVFPDFPTEIRLKIWKSARPEARYLVLEDSKIRDAMFCRTPVPALLHVNRESREVALKWYKLSFARISCDNAHTFFDWESDGLCINFLRGEPRSIMGGVAEPERLRIKRVLWEFETGVMAFDHHLKYDTKIITLSADFMAQLNKLFTRTAYYYPKIADMKITDYKHDQMTGSCESSELEVDWRKTEGLRVNGKTTSLQNLYQKVRSRASWPEEFSAEMVTWARR